MTMIYAPNYTQIPNIILDSLFLLSNAEFKIISFICRYTFGFHRERAKMSLVFIMKGTGLSRQGVVNGLESLRIRRWIEKIPSGDGFEYQIKIHSIEEAVNSVYQSTQLPSQLSLPGGSTQLTSTSQLSLPEVVNSVDSNKEKKKKKERSKESKSDRAHEAIESNSDFQEETIASSPQTFNGPVKPRVSRKIKGSANSPAEEFSDFQEIYNLDKPAAWAAIVVLNSSRKKVFADLVKTAGGREEAKQMLRNALAYARSQPWFSGRDLDFENFVSKGKIIGLHERWLAQSGKSKPIALPDWLTSPDDRFIEWLARVFLPQKAGYGHLAGADTAIAQAEGWLAKLKHGGSQNDFGKLEEAEIAWKAFQKYQEQQQRIEETRRQIAPQQPFIESKLTPEERQAKARAILKQF